VHGKGFTLTAALQYRIFGMGDNTAKSAMPHAGDQPGQDILRPRGLWPKSVIVQAAGSFLAPIGGKESGKSVNGAGTSVPLRMLFDHFIDFMASTCYLGRCIRIETIHAEFQYSTKYTKCPRR